jgi:hypothetical protein
MPDATRQPLHHCERLSATSRKLESILNEFGDRVDGALTETGGLLYDSSRNALHPVDRRTPASTSAAALTTTRLAA